MPATESIHQAKFKAKAKTLHRAVLEGSPDALKKIKPYFDNPEDFKLTQAQLVIARLYRCKSWRELSSKDDWLACSFCKKWQYELNKLIAGPEVYVCDECVEGCNGILRENLAQP